MAPPLENSWWSRLWISRKNSFETLMLLVMHKQLRVVSTCIWYLTKKSICRIQLVSYKLILHAL